MLFLELIDIFPTLVFEEGLLWIIVDRGGVLGCVDEEHGWVQGC
jgi:hypothetical protein